MTARAREPVVHIVDDDQAICSSLRLLLKSRGRPATSHGSAEAFLADYDPEQPGCLVLDVRMPGIERRHAGAGHWLERIAGCVLAGRGLKLLVSR